MGILLKTVSITIKENLVFCQAGYNYKQNKDVASFSAHALINNNCMR